MILGALIDAGVSLASLRSALGSLAIEPDVIWTERVIRAGLSATKFCVRGEDEPDHGHDHRGHEHEAHGHHQGHEHAHGHHHHHDHDEQPGLLREAPSTDHEHHGP